MGDSKTKYMHTIDGRPALWSGEQIVFPAINSAVRLVDDLRTIRRHQLLTEEFRLHRKFDHDPDKYNYVRVRCA
jgi:hypothetical protein